MAKTKHRRFRAVPDPRELPMYHPSDAALYLSIPEATLRQWFFGRSFRGSEGVIRWSEPLIEAADREARLLSFANLAEAHVLQATRDRSIPMKSVRAALQYVNDHAHVPHPLITLDFYSEGKHLFIKVLTSLVNASRYGQLALSFLDPYLERLVRDETGMPFRLFPMRANAESSIMLDLNIASGQPVLTDTGILAEVLFERNQAGETLEELARDYSLDQRRVEQAIRYVQAAAA